MEYTDQDRVIFLADMPNPVHGMSNVNKAFYNLFLNENKLFNLKLINTAPSNFHNLFPSKAWTFVRFLHVFCQVIHLFFFLLLNPKISKAYRPINGGGGQLYDCFFLLILKIFKVRVLIHHHSFQYLNKKSFITSLLFLISKNNSEHIVLGDKMKKLLISKYDIKEKIHVVSNAFLFHENNNHMRVDNTLEDLTIGHLANLCVEKGVLEFLDSFEILSAKVPNLTAKLAGPINGENVKEKVFDMCAKYKNFHYLGAIYGEEKSLFFESLDIFIFPSKYINEAEPLVLYEAAQFGVFCIGSDIGCMKDMLLTIGGIPVARKELTPKLISNLVFDEITKGSLSSSSKMHRLNLFNELVVNYSAQANKLIKSFFYESKFR